MHLHSLTWKEMWQHKTELLASFVAILLSVAVFVAGRTISLSARDTLREQVHHLGSNMLVLPADAQVNDYYTADFGEAVIPESYAQKLAASEFREKAHRLVPKLSSRLTIKGQTVLLTGVLPQAELQTQPYWRRVNLFLKGAGGTAKGVGSEAPQRLTLEPAYLVREPGARLQPAPPRLTVDNLGPDDLLLGSDLAEALDLREGAPLTVRGHRFSVDRILPRTGTIDDIRAFIHLHTAQRLLGQGRVVNVIEVVGCGCHLDLVALGREMEHLLPGTQVVTIRDIADAQWNTVRLVEQFAKVLLVVLLILSGAGIANDAVANVQERRQEIGMLLALGATPGRILALFLGKAALLGIGGGLGGFAAGTILAIGLVSRLVHTALSPVPILAGWALLLSVGLALTFTWVPAFRAARLDPATIFQEEGL